MKLCRYRRSRLGLVCADEVRDITYTVQDWADPAWPPVPGDPLIRHLEQIRELVAGGAGTAPRQALADVALQSVITAPTKIMAAPANYREHAERDTLDPGVDQGVHRAQLSGMTAPVEELGLFLKATSSLAGPGDGIRVAPSDHRTDYEVELVVIIGRTARNVAAADAMSCVAGYCVGLDMSVRGKADRSFRKSADTFTVLGPWLTTADEIEDPGDLALWLTLNGQERQRSSTAAMTVPIPRLIELAAAAYTLHPGDVLMTGTPAGVGPVVAGDVIVAGCEGLGAMTVAVTDAD